MAHEVARLIVAYRAWAEGTRGEKVNNGSRGGTSYTGETGWVYLDRVVGYGSREQVQRWHRVAGRAAMLVVERDKRVGRQRPESKKIMEARKRRGRRAA